MLEKERDSGTDIQSVAPDWSFLRLSTTADVLACLRFKFVFYERPRNFRRLESVRRIGQYRFRGDDRVLDYRFVAVLLCPRERAT